MLIYVRLDGLSGQFVIGLVLGLVWSPCVGPTLGPAIVLASQGSHLPQVALIMGIFGLGVGLPVVALAYVSREALAKTRGGLMQAGKTGKAVLGAITISLSILILCGADSPLETCVVDRSPSWPAKLTTHF